MYKKAMICSIINFVIMMVVFRIQIAFGLFPSLALYQVFIAIVASLLVGVVIFLMNKDLSEFERLVEDNLHSQVVGEYLFGNLSRRKLKKILKEKE